MSDSPHASEMYVFRRFRRLAAGSALAVTLVAATACLCTVGPVPAQGAAMGGLAGIIVFWMKAIRSEALLDAPSRMRRFVISWALLGTFVYCAVLYRAYTMDRTYLTGLWAAGGGLLIIRAVVIVLGVTGLDLRQEEADGTHR